MNTTRTNTAQPANQSASSVRALPDQYSQDLKVDRFGLRVAAVLSAEPLAHDISERLRVARQQAVAQRKKELASVFSPAAAASGTIIVQGGGEAALGGRSPGLDDEPGLWTRIASFLPLLALVVGLVAIHFHQNERRANELAEIDAALLADDLPPAAYADPGFVQFLKANQDRR
jgi:hypothetical protein